MSNESQRQEKREHPRYDITAYVDYAGNEVLIYHHIQNISLGGLCIRTSCVEETGTVVDLVISFPDLDASMAAQGEVVWVNCEPPLEMGIRFLDLDDEKKQILRRYLTALAK